ncbi:MAG TPA: DUF5011 domain-containing protein [Mucilaginibacter sp.]|jgi:hypothetical protein
MKRYISYLIAVVFSMIMVSCNKDSFNYPPGYVGISKITTYPIITVAGQQYMAVAVGGTFTDPGATAKAGSADVKVVTSGTVDAATVGVYLLTYTATNTDGFSATANRYVAIYSTDATAQNNDFSGDYARNTNGSIAEWTKVAPGVYTVFNPGGAPGTNLTVFMFNQTGYKIFIPDQIAGGSPTSSTSESTTPGAPGTISQYKMEIVNPGYGTAIRTFNLQ